MQPSHVMDKNIRLLCILKLRVKLSTVSAIMCIDSGFILFSKMADLFMKSRVEKLTFE